MIKVNEKASKRTLKHYYYKYLSQSDTCQSESAQEKKRMCIFEKTTDGHDNVFF